MDFSFTEAQQEIREAILKICARFGDDYWLEGSRRRLS
jgi:acyl-CoA dehydrogenase